MKILILAMGLFAGFSALALEVQFTCQPKAFGCYNEMGNTDCYWQGLRTRDYVLPMRESFNPVGEPSYRAVFRDSIDNHFLTLSIVWNDSQLKQGLELRAQLDGGNVFSETTGTEKIDVSLRNDRFGRGYVCTDFQIVR